jgi:hypothetical protein
VQTLNKLTAAIFMATGFVVASRGPIYPGNTHVILRELCEISSLRGLLTGRWGAGVRDHGNLHGVSAAPEVDLL